jgi:hypothetical protein
MNNGYSHSFEALLIASTKIHDCKMTVFINTKSTNSVTFCNKFRLILCSFAKNKSVSLQKAINMFSMKEVAGRHRSHWISLWKLRCLCCFVKHCLDNGTDNYQHNHNNKQWWMLLYNRLSWKPEITAHCGVNKPVLHSKSSGAWAMPLSQRQSIFVNYS